MSERARLTRRSFILAASAAGVMVGAGGLSVLFRRQSAPLVRPLPTSTPFIEVAGSAVASVLSSAPALARPAALEPDGYVATAPRVLRRRQTETVAVSLFRGEEAAAGPVAVALLQDGQRLVEATAEVNGRGTVHLPALTLADGEYELQVQAAGDTSEAPVRV